MVHGGPHPQGFVEDQNIGLPGDWRLPRRGDVGNQDALDRLEVVAEQQDIALLSRVLEENAIGTSCNSICVGVELAESVDPTIGVAQRAA